MAYRNYRKRHYRRKSMPAELLRDTASIANNLPWQGCIVFGFSLFTLFYWILPALLTLYIDSTMEGNRFKVIAEAVILRRLHWLDWIAIACLIISLFFAIRNYFTQSSMGYYGRSNVSFISKIIAKFLD